MFLSIELVWSAKEKSGQKKFDDDEKKLGLMKFF